MCECMGKSREQRRIGENQVILAIEKKDMCGALIGNVA